MILTSMAAAFGALLLLGPASASTARPANDNFANAQTVPGATGSLTGTNLGATLESGEPQHGFPDGASVWYRWTAPASGAATVSTAGSNFDTVLSVYTGSSLTALTRIGASDDYNGTPQSQVGFTATAGTSYQIAVAGYKATAGVRTGSITLNWSGPAAAPPPPPPSSAPANDNFANAQQASGASGSLSGTNVGATLENGEPQHGFPDGASVWYRWTAPASGAATINTAGSNFDTVLAVYTGSSLTALTQLATSDDYNGTPQSQVGFTATAGTSYQIAVAGYNNPTAGVRTGSITLNWNGPAAAGTPPPAGDTTPPAVSLGQPTGGATVSGVATLSATASDAGGVATVEFLVNGATVARTTTTPYTLAWDSTTTPNGSATIAARATDTAGNVATSTPLTVTIQNAAAGSDPVVLAAGDVSSCTSSGDEATALLLGVPGATVAMLGDSTELGTAADLQQCYDPSWGAVKARTRPAAGNHDYAVAGALPYFAYFGAAAGDPAKGYYSYELGSWHVVVLNSNCAEVGGCGAGAPQEQWLRADLAAHPTTCTLAYWHHPLFSSENDPDATRPELATFWQDLVSAGADVVLTAHAHIYERFAPQRGDGTADPRGVREFTVGTGGHYVSSIGTIQPNSEARQATSFGVLKLTLHAGSYDWQFLPVAGASYADSGSTACH